MDTDYRQKIQERAFEIWEEEGRPADRDRDHWLQAEQEIMGASGADEDAEDLSAIAHADEVPMAASSPATTEILEPEKSTKKGGRAG